MLEFLPSSGAAENLLNQVPDRLRTSIEGASRTLVHVQCSVKHDQSNGHLELELNIPVDVSVSRMTSNTFDEIEGDVERCLSEHLASAVGLAYRPLQGQVPANGFDDVIWVDVPAVVAAAREAWFEGGEEEIGVEQNDEL